ncbi:MAG: c-type cytochrome [Acidobacteriota bacterium]
MQSRSTKAKPAARKTARVIAVLLAWGLFGCVAGPKSGSGFRLPDGDAVAGRELFVSRSCHVCHTIVGEELGPPPLEGPVSVALGGTTTRVKNYGQLVTSIINPSHRIETVYQQQRTAEDGSSLMPSFNETLTVQNLIDLVAYLQSHYEVIPPAYEYYPYRYGP